MVLSNDHACSKANEAEVTQSVLLQLGEQPFASDALAAGAGVTGASSPDQNSARDAGPGEKIGEARSETCRKCTPPPSSK